MRKKRASYDIVCSIDDVCKFLHTSPAVAAGVEFGVIRRGERTTIVFGGDRKHEAMLFLQSLCENKQRPDNMMMLVNDIFYQDVASLRERKIIAMYTFDDYTFVMFLTPDEKQRFLLRSKHDRVAKIGGYSPRRGAPAQVNPRAPAQSISTTPRR